MIYSVYLYYDRVAGEYSSPRLEINVGTAKRNFNAACKANLVIGVDMELYYLGSFDSSKGCFVELLDKPSFVCRFEVISDEQ